MYSAGSKEIGNRLKLRHKWQKSCLGLPAGNTYGAHAFFAWKKVPPVVVLSNTFFLPSTKKNKGRLNRKSDLWTIFKKNNQQNWCRILSARDDSNFCRNDSKSVV